MNQDNNFNQNNFNSQGNNGISNNQPLNNQGMNVNQQATPSFQQPINQTNIGQPANLYETDNNQSQIDNANLYQQPYTQKNDISNYTNTEKPKNKKSKLLILIIAVLLVVVIGVIIIVTNLSKNKNDNEPISVSSTFEKIDNHYVLKDDKGKILLDNISSHSEFCNGTTQIINTDGDYAIINGSGKFIAEYGKYDRVEQYHSWGGTYYCFYKVKDYTTNQSSILKYDGNILYSDNNNKTLKNISLKNYSVKYAILTTPDKYQVINYLGDTFLSFDRSENDSEPEVYAGGDGKYTSIYYNGLSYVYDLKTFNQMLTPLNGKYQIQDVYTKSETITIAGFENKKEEDSIILFGYPNINDTNMRKTYVLHKGKITFETDKCLNVAFVNDEVRCLVQNGGVFEYYDVNGKKLDK